MRKAILDCDPGHDDAIAMLLAYASPAIDLLAVTTVAGNQTVDKTTLNARRVSTAAGMDVAIASGADRPILRELITAGDIHGESGLDGPVLPSPAAPVESRHAVDVIVDAVMSQPGEVTLIPVGPLTNIALALRREPRLAASVAEVVLMGGSYTRGNHTPAAEFNILVDPEAAAIVFGAPWQVTMVGLDLTHQARATEEVVARIAAVDTVCSRLVVDMLAFFASTYERVEGLRAPPVHDPCAVAYAIDPTLMTVANAFVGVETEGHLTAGMTVVDFRGRLGRPLDTRVATRLDVDRFWTLIVDALTRLR